MVAFNPNEAYTYSFQMNVNDEAPFFRDQTITVKDRTFKM